MDDKQARARVKEYEVDNYIEERLQQKIKSMTLYIGFGMIIGAALGLIIGILLK